MTDRNGVPTTAEGGGNTHAETSTSFRSIGAREVRLPDPQRVGDASGSRHVGEERGDRLGQG